MVVLLAALACVLMLATSLFWREAYTGDEGFYGVTAQNMLQSPDYLLRPSFFPAGDFEADKEGFAHPPFNSYVYAFGLWLARGSLVGPDLLNALVFAALLFAVYRLLGRFDPQAGRLGVLLLAASPAMLAAFAMLEAEPLMTTFGVASLYCCVRSGFAAGQRRWLFLGGLCFGFSFAFKLWLCGPIAIAVGATLAIRAARSGFVLRPLLAGLLLFIAGAIIPVGMHLLAVAVFFPQDLRFWLHDIYFGIVTQSGISGSKLGGSDLPAGWANPVWYYGAAIYREHFFLVPILAFGAGSLLRDKRFNGELLCILLVGIAGLIPLSAMKVKEPLYILPCVVCLYLLAGCCLAALARRLQTGGRLDPFSRRLGGLAMAGMLVIVPLLYLRGFKPDEITRSFVVVHTIVWLALPLAFAWCRRGNSPVRLEIAAAAACVLALIASTTHNALNRHPRDEAIARLVRPYLQSNSPATLSLIASNFKSYQLHTFRRGVYWHQLPLHAQPESLLDSAPFGSVRVFILGPVDQQKPEMAPWVRWLETRTTEKTGEVERQLGAASDFRVFVRDAAQPASAD